MSSNQMSCCNFATVCEVEYIIFMPFILLNAQTIAFKREVVTFCKDYVIAVSSTFDYSFIIECFLERVKIIGVCELFCHFRETV